MIQFIIKTFFYEISRSFLLAKFPCAYIAAKFSPVNLLNSGEVIHLLSLGILFTRTVRAVVVARLVILDILPFTHLF